MANRRLDRRRTGREDESPARLPVAGHRPLVDTGRVLARVRRWFDGAGWFVGLAITLFVFALLAVLLELQSPDLLLWTGHRVTGTEQGGIVSYRWHGQAYSLNASGYGSSKSVSVYLDPANPGPAMVDNVADRALVAVLIGGPVAVGVILLIVGLTRNYRWGRRQARRARQLQL
jgi:hypothetical protein